MTHQKEEVILRAENITKNYAKKVVIRDISFEIKNITRPGLTQGQVISLIGRSGIGKSTIARILAGIEKPTSGSVILDNGSRNLAPVKEGDVGMVFQNYIMFEDLTVKQNFLVALKHRPDSNRLDTNEFIRAYAHEFGIEDHLNKFPKQLSGGQRQRAAIIVQLLNGSNFLIMDEPLSGLDVLVIDKVTALLNKIACSDEYQTLIIISHDLENSLAISDTAFILGFEDGHPGAILKKEICLVDRGLAWRPDIKDLPQFRETLKEVKSLL